MKCSFLHLHRKATADTQTVLHNKLHLTVFLAKVYIIPSNHVALGHFLTLLHSILKLEERHHSLSFVFHVTLYHTALEQCLYLRPLFLF